MALSDADIEFAQALRTAPGWSWVAGCAVYHRLCSHRIRAVVAGGHDVILCGGAHGGDDDYNDRPINGQSPYLIPDPHDELFSGVLVTLVQRLYGDGAHVERATDGTFVVLREQDRMMWRNQGRWEYLARGRTITLALAEAICLWQPPVIEEEEE